MGWAITRWKEVRRSQRKFLSPCTIEERVLSRALNEREKEENKKKERRGKGKREEIIIARRHAEIPLAGARLLIAVVLCTALSRNEDPSSIVACTVSEYVGRSATNDVGGTARRKTHEKAREGATGTGRGMTVRRRG